ncbi:Titin [Acipenser ruthenus]|uniref:Titin n=1 Tax=Acipenser ruthenus TaxID=7906 RepID=A0A662YXA3_ACIRT|nr:Titin [Acipenser ruthenus]
MTLYVGKPARFQCAVTGSPPMNIVWQKAGLDISSDGNYKISTDKKKNILEIPSLQLDNKGIYSCKATNAFGTDICSAELRVIDKPQFVKKLEPLPVAVGHIIRLECQVDEDTGVCITWSRDGKKLHLSMDYKITFEEKVAVLEIPNAKLKDSGNYVCTASNDAGSSTCSASVTVREPPSFLKKLESKIVWKKGVAARLQCSVKGSPELHVTWFKNDKELSTSDKYKITFVDALAVIEFFEVSVEDSGNYTCEVLNESGCESCSAKITVKEPPYFSKELKPVEVMKGTNTALECEIAEPPSFVKKPDPSKLLMNGSSVKLECKVTGTPEIKIKWLKNESEISASDKYRMSFTNSVAVLEIINTSIDDSGDYICEAHSEAGSDRCSSTVRVKVPPKFVQKPENVAILKPGQNKILKCQVVGTPEIKISWFQDGNEISSSDKYKMSFDNSLVSLEITGAKVEDSGVYVCEAHNEAGSESCSVEVKVKEPPVFKKELTSFEVVKASDVMLDCEVTGTAPFEVTWYKDAKEIRTKPAKIIEKPKAVSVTVGDPVSLESIVAGTPELKVKWFKDDKELMPSRQYKMSFMKNVASLKIQSVKNEDSGEYAFEVSNGIGSSSCKVNLIVLEPPKFVKKLESSKVVKPKDQTRFECKVTGSPEIQISWFKNDSKISESEKYRMSFINSLAVLEIENISLEDSGDYICEALNEAGSDSCSTTVTVKDPPAFIKAPEPVEGIKGKDLSLECELSGSPPFEITWYKDKRQIKDSKKYKVTHEGCLATLHILNLEGSDVGEYQCKAANNVGSDSCTGTVKLKEPPVFVKKLSNVTAVTGEEVTLGATIKGSQPITVSWVKDKDVIRDSDNTRISFENNLVTLTIINADTANSGKYICQIKNDAGMQECMASLSVLEPAAILEKPEPISVTAGDPVTLECTISGTPELKGKWFRNGNEMVSGRKYKMTLSKNVAALKILSTEKDVKTPPIFTRKMTSLQETEGLPVKFECRVTGSSPIEVSWLKDDESLANEDDIKMSFIDNTAILEIAQTEMKHSGEYTCVASNVVGSASCSAKLTLKEPRFAPVFDKKLEPLEVTVGDSFALECHMTGSLPIKVTWSKDKKDIRAAGNYKITCIDDTPRLTILKADKGDSGQYSCEASNDIGKDSCTAQVAVKERRVPPTFTKKPSESIEDTEGKIIKLEGRVSGSQPMNISWFKDDQEIQLSDSYDMSFKSNVVQLCLKKARLSDTGSYTCKVSNEAGTTSCNVSVLIKELKRPPVFDLPLKPVTVNVGESLQISCHVHGSDPIKIQWQKDKKEVKPSDKCQITFTDGTSALEINAVAKTDAGDYVCKATNEAGSESCKAKVTVKDKAVGASPAPAAAAKPAKLDNLFFIEEPKSIKVTEKGVATFIAKVGGDPIPNVKWMKGKWRQINHGGRIVVEQKGQEAKLEIKEVTKTDSGQYRCLATNKFGEIECSTNLEVEEKKELTVDADFRAKLKKVPSKQKEQEEDKDIDIVELLRNVDPKEYEKYARMYGITDYRGLLQALEQLKKLKGEETHQLELEGRSAGEEQEFDELVSFLQQRMTQTEPITLVKDIEDQTVTVNKDAVFECEIKINYPEIKLSWYKGTAKLDTDEKYDISIEGDRHLLKIYNCETQDQGNYRIVCGPHISSAKLTVAEPVVEHHLQSLAAQQIQFTKNIRDIVVNEHQSATFECEVSFDDAIVTWYKDSTELKESSKYNFRKEERCHFMTIHSVTADDEGVYSVIARLEPIGEAKSTAELCLSSKGLYRNIL